MSLPGGLAASGHRGLTLVDQASWARVLAEEPMEGAERSKHISDLCARLLGGRGGGISMVTTTANT